MCLDGWCKNAATAALRRVEDAVESLLALIIVSAILVAGLWAMSTLLADLKELSFQKLPIFADRTGLKLWSHGVRVLRSASKDAEEPVPLWFDGEAYEACKVQWEELGPSTGSLCARGIKAEVASGTLVLLRRMRWCVECSGEVVVLYGDDEGLVGWVPSEVVWPLRIVRNGNQRESGGSVLR
jgi:hypothetical protein